MEAIYVREVYARYRGSRRKRVEVTSPEAAAAFIQGMLKDNTREHFIALYLDAAHKVASYAVVSVGTANATYVAPREVFQLAVLAGACGVIVAHNHPSGRLEPSPEDIHLTGVLRDAGDIMQIPLLDHLIVADSRFLSLKETGRM